MECLRHEKEKCDSLLGYFVTHSLGSATGGGLGTYILEKLAKDSSQKFRLSCCVFPDLPSLPSTKDVVAYNTILALNKLAEHADCVLPIMA